jgi:hypothetical protein
MRIRLPTALLAYGLEGPSASSTVDNLNRRGIHLRNPKTCPNKPSHFLVPDSKRGDHSDIVVHTPFGEIPWNEVSRLDDAEMQALMIDVVNRTYQFLQELFDEKRSGELLLRLAEKDPVPDWENPG